jgi:hypothetical protein
VRVTAGDCGIFDHFELVLHSVGVSCPMTTAVAGEGLALVGGAGSGGAVRVCGGVGVVDALENDVFISYARTDNQRGGCRGCGM